MSDIFISYAREDEAKARMLAKVLEQQGWSVWWDLRITPGRAFDEVIEQALEAARCIIVLWSQQSVSSEWVRIEASVGRQRRILVPALIEDGVKVPLAFSLLHASRLTDWRGQTIGHAQFDEFKSAIANLLGGASIPGTTISVAQPTGTTTGPEPSRGVRKPPVPPGAYLDPTTGLMWTKEDNGSNISWNEANQYAKDLRLGGYSDWRLPSIDELEALYDPVIDAEAWDHPIKARHELQIRKPMRLTAFWVWSASEASPRSAWRFNFRTGLRLPSPVEDSSLRRALCVRHSVE